MPTINNIIHLLLPVLGVILLVIGLKTHNKIYVLVCLWIAAVGTMLHYHSSDSQILGSYFGYIHSSLYTINLLLLLFSTLYILYSYTKNLHSQKFHYVKDIISTLTTLGIITIIINVWLNAFFIENRLIGTPVLQIATFGHLDYCDYPYVFYKINKKNQLDYLCPNHFGLIPSLGTLKIIPDYILQQLPVSLQSKILHADES